MNVILQCVCLVAAATPAQTAAAPKTTLPAYEAKADAAIERGLAYLASIQIDETKTKTLKCRIWVKPRGNDARRWKRIGRKPVLGESSTVGLGGSFAQYRPGNMGITSLALMAFLSKGHVPGRGPYGETINRGLDYILSQTKEKSSFLIARNVNGHEGGIMYSHSITALLLTEVSGMVTPERQKRIDEMLPQALGLIVGSQYVKKHNPKHIGGWRYQPWSRDADLSLTGWNIMALRAAKLNGAAVPSDAIHKAMKMVLYCRNARGGFAYQPGSNWPDHQLYGLTGSAVLCMALCGYGDHEAVRPAAAFLLKNTPVKWNAGGHRYYRLYYASQAAFQLGPDYWRQMAPRIYSQLLTGQKADGSWPAVGNPLSSAECSAYATAMAILTMTPPYQQLPIYQRVKIKTPPAAKTGAVQK